MVKGPVAENISRRLKRWNRQNVSRPNELSVYYRVSAGVHSSASARGMRTPRSGPPRLPLTALSSTSHGTGRTGIVAMAGRIIAKFNGRTRLHFWSWSVDAPRSEGIQGKSKSLTAARLNAERAIEMWLKSNPEARER